MEPYCLTDHVHVETVAQFKIDPEIHARSRSPSTMMILLLMVILLCLGDRYLRLSGLFFLVELFAARCADLERDAGALPGLKHADIDFFRDAQ